MCYEFESAGAVCSIEESSEPQNLLVSIVLKASKSVGAKGDVTKIYGFVHTFPDTIVHLTGCLTLKCPKVNGSEGWKDQ
jgi:hypothetical protein